VALKSLPCKQCGGEMVRKKVQRLGGCLGVIGTFFGVVGLIAALIGGFMTWAGTKATVETIAEIDKGAYEVVWRPSTVGRGPSLRSSVRRSASHLRP